MKPMPHSAWAERKDRRASEAGALHTTELLARLGVRLVPLPEAISKTGPPPAPPTSESGQRRSRSSDGDHRLRKANSEHPHRMVVVGPELPELPGDEPYQFSPPKWSGCRTSSRLRRGALPLDIPLRVADHLEKLDATDVVGRRLFHHCLPLGRAIPVGKNSGRRGAPPIAMCRASRRR